MGWMDVIFDWKVFNGIINKNFVSGSMSYRLDDSLEKYRISTAEIQVCLYKGANFQTLFSDTRSVR